MAARENDGQDYSGQDNKDRASGLESDVTETVPVNSDTKLDGADSNVREILQCQEQQDDSNAPGTVKGEGILQNNASKEIQACEDGEMSAFQNTVEPKDNQKEAVELTRKRKDEKELENVGEDYVESQINMQANAADDISLDYFVVQDQSSKIRSPRKDAQKVERRDRSKHRDTQEVSTSKDTEDEEHIPEIKIKPHCLNQSEEECFSNVVEDMTVIEEQTHEVEPYPKEQESEDTEKPTKHITVDTFDSADRKQLPSKDLAMPGACQHITPSFDNFQKSRKGQDVDRKMVKLGADGQLSEQVSVAEVISEPEQPLTAKSSSRLENDSLNEKIDYRESSDISLDSREESFVVLNNSISQPESEEIVGKCENLYSREASADKDPNTSTSLLSDTSSRSNSFCLVSLPSGSINEEKYLDTDHKQPLPLDMEEKKGENTEENPMEAKLPDNGCSGYDEPLKKDGNILHTESNVTQRHERIQIGRCNTDGTDEIEEDDKNESLGLSLDSLLNAGTSLPSDTNSKSNSFSLVSLPKGSNNEEKYLDTNHKQPLPLDTEERKGDSTQSNSVEAKRPDDSCSGNDSLKKEGNILHTESNVTQSGHISSEECFSSKGVDNEGIPKKTMADEQNDMSSGLDLGSLESEDESIEVIDANFSQLETNTTECDKVNDMEIPGAFGNTESFISKDLQSSLGSSSDSYCVIPQPVDVTHFDPKPEQAQSLTSDDHEKEDQRPDKSRTGTSDNGDEPVSFDSFSNSGSSSSECNTKPEDALKLQTGTAFSEMETYNEDDKKLSENVKQKREQREDDQTVPDITGEPSSMHSFDMVDNVTSSIDNIQCQTETEDPPELQRTISVDEQDNQISKFSDRVNNKKDGEDISESTGRLSLGEVENQGQTVGPPDRDGRNQTQTVQPGNKLDSDDEVDEEDDDVATEGTPGGITGEPSSMQSFNIVDSVTSSTDNSQHNTEIEDVPEWQRTTCLNEQDNQTSKVSDTVNNKKDGDDTSENTGRLSLGEVENQDQTVGPPDRDGRNQTQTVQPGNKLDSDDEADEEGSNMETEGTPDFVDSINKAKEEGDNAVIEDAPGFDDDGNDDAEKEGNNAATEDTTGLVDNNDIDRRDAASSDSSDKTEDKNPERDPNKFSRQKEDDKDNTPEADDEESGQKIVGLGHRDMKDDVSTDPVTDRKEEKESHGASGNTGFSIESSLPSSSGSGCGSGSFSIISLSTEFVNDGKGHEPKSEQAQSSYNDEQETEDQRFDGSHAENRKRCAREGEEPSFDLQGSEMTNSQSSIETENAQKLHTNTLFHKKDPMTNKTNETMVEKKYDKDSNIISTNDDRSSSEIDKGNKTQSQLLTDKFDRYENMEVDVNTDQRDDTDEFRINPHLENDEHHIVKAQLDTNENMEDDVNTDKTEDADKSRNSPLSESDEHQIVKAQLDKIDQEEYEIANFVRTENSDTNTVAAPTGCVDEDKRNNITATKNSDYSKWERESNGLEDKMEAQASTISQDWSVISNFGTGDGPNTAPPKQDSSKTNEELDDADYDFTGSEVLTGKNQQENLRDSHDNGAHKSYMKATGTEMHKGLGFFRELDQDDDDDDDDDRPESDTYGLETLHINEENLTDDGKVNIHSRDNVGENDTVRTGSSSFKEDLRQNQTDPIKKPSLLLGKENSSLHDPKFTEGKMVGDHYEDEKDFEQSTFDHLHEPPTAESGSIDHETAIESQVDTRNLHPEDKVQQNEPSTADSYEIPPVSVICIRRMWTGVMKEGRNTDIVPIRLENKIDLGKWTLLFSNEAALAQLKVDLDQDETAVERDQGSDVFLTVKYLGTNFHVIDQVSHWWLQAIKTIRKNLDAFKVYTCHLRTFKREVVLSAVREHVLIKEEQVIYVEDDISSNDLFLVGHTEAVNTIICHLLKALGKFDIKKDGNPLCIMHFTTEAENAQLMEMFNLPDVIKRQKDIDLLIEREELYVIGLKKPEEDVKKMLETDDWMYSYLYKEVLVHKPLLEMLKNRDNLQYVQKRIKSQKKVFHITPTEQSLVLFAESDEVAKQLMRTLTGCFKNKEYRLLKQPDPLERLQRIIQKYGDLVQTIIMQNEFHCLVTVYAREDKFEEFNKDVDNFSEELLQLTQTQTDDLETNKTKELERDEFPEEHLQQTQKPTNLLKIDKIPEELPQQNQTQTKELETDEFSVEHLQQTQKPTKEPGKDMLPAELRQQNQTQTKELEINKHVYHFLRRHRRKAFEKAEVVVDEEQNYMVLKITGTSVIIKEFCQMLSKAREDLETQACVLDVHTRSRDEKYISHLENKYHCCIEMQDIETDESFADTDDKLKSTYDEPEQSWKYRNTTVCVTQGDVHQANVDLVVHPDSEQQLGLVVLSDKDTETGRKCKSSSFCKLGIPEFKDMGKDKTGLSFAFDQLFQRLNQNKGIHSIGIPVYCICNWDYKKFVKRMLASLQGFIHKVVLLVPNETVEQSVADIISEVSDDQPMAEPIAVNVKLGDISKEKVDVIVNTTASDLELDKGQGVSVAILKAAGDKIQKQCRSRNKYGKTLPTGEIIVTDGFKLACKEVYHGTLQEWSSSDNYKQQHAITDLKKFIQNCLKETLQHQRESISFPVLGTGILAYPTDLVAEIMLQEIKAFGDQHPNRSLKMVNIIVYTKEKPVFEIFQHKLRLYEFPMNVSPEDSFPMGLRIGDVDLQIASEDVKAATDYQGLVLMWTLEDVNNPLAGCAEIIRAAGQDVVFCWNKHKKDLHKHKVFTAAGGNLPQTTIFNVFTDKEKLQESFITALTINESSGFSSVVFYLGKKDALSSDLDRYASSMYQALKLHENALGPQPIRMKICTDSLDSCAALQEKFVCLMTTKEMPTEDKGTVRQLVVKIRYTITGKKQDINRVVIALTKDDVAEDLHYTDESEDTMGTKSFGKMEMTNKIMKTELEKKDHVEETYSRETDVALEAWSGNKQDTLKGPLVRPKDFTSTSSIAHQSSSPVSQYPHLHATDDVKRCLVAESKHLFSDELRCALQDTLKKHKPVAVICPYKGKRDEALVVYDGPADASTVLQDHELKSKMQILKIQLKQMPPQVICNLKAGLDITKLLLSGNRTLQADIVEKSLRDSCGVKIRKEPGQWYLEGTLHQLKEAGEYLSGLYVDIEISQRKNEKTLKSEDDINIDEVIIEPVTVAVYAAFLFFSCRSDDKTALSELHYDESKKQVVIKGTYDDIKKNKKSLERIMKCECDSINITGKKMTVSVVKEKLKELGKNPEVYIHVITNENSVFVDDISFLGLDVDAVKKVKQQSFEILGLATNRRHRFAKSGGAEGKEPYSLQKSCTTDSNDRKKLHVSEMTRNTANDRLHGMQRKGCHFKAADKFPVYVYQGDILNLDVDCIVNAANSELDHGGGVAGAIAGAAGPQFVIESRNYVKQYGKIKVGHSCHTSAGHLKYKCVIHTVGPRWNDYRKSIRLDRCSEELRQAVESAVLEANNCGMASVAIPAISSGIYGVPHEVCVTQYALGVIGACSQLERQQRASLQEIHFVDKNFTLINMMKNTFQEFLSLENEAEYPEFSGSQDAHLLSSEHEKSFSPPGSNNFQHGSGYRPVSPPPQEIPRFDNRQLSVRDQYSHKTTERENEHQPSPNTAGQQNDVYPYSGTDIEHEVFKYVYQLSESFEIQVYSVDILDTNVDGLVFGEDKELQTRSRIGRAIRNIDSKSFDKEVDKIKVKKIKIGNVYGLQLENVRQGVILLLVTPSWGAPGTTHGDCMNGLKKGVTNVLKKAAEFGLRSIAMPVLGTGNTGAPVGEAAKIIIEKIQEYFSTADKSCPLKQVHLVSKDEDTVDIIKTIMDGKLLKKREIHDILLPMGNHKPMSAARNVQSFGEKTLYATSAHDKEQLTCVICMADITGNDEIKALYKCNHVFHKVCIDKQFKHKPTCPTCGAIYGVIYGNQPEGGKMDIKRWSPPGLPDFKNAGFFEITYSFNDGIQREGHPNPGSRYKGTRRTAYLPDTNRGKVILEMLKIAFERRLTFTIGRSRTTGKENVVTWNDIHHKTSMQCGPERFGYPDAGYFDHVTEELKVKGVTPEDVKKVTPMIQNCPSQ